MTLFLRVDERLIHGQVVAGWIPHLGVERVAVVDERAAASSMSRAAMRIALPERISLSLLAADDDLEDEGGEILVLFPDLREAEARIATWARRGIVIRRLNLGNLHFAAGRVEVSPSLFLSPSEVEALGRIEASGVPVEARALPGDPPLGLAAIRRRFEGRA